MRNPLPSTPDAAPGTAPIPALRFSWLTRFFDPLIGLFFSEQQLRERLISLAEIQPGHAVLDLGCGTGTLITMIKNRHPAAVLTGLDADPKILALAREKLIAHETVATLTTGSATCPPFEAETFDRVISSLVFHHLRREEKQRSLREALRVLKPGGRMHILDWGAPDGAIQRGLSFLVRAFDGFEVTADNVHGRLPRLISDAGFQEVTEIERHRTLLGTLAHYRGIKPTV